MYEKQARIQIIAFSNNDHFRNKQKTLYNFCTHGGGEGYHAGGVVAYWLSRLIQLNLAYGILPIPTELVGTDYFIKSGHLNSQCFTAQFAY